MVCWRHLHKTGHVPDEDADFTGVSGPQPLASDAEGRAPCLGPSVGEDAAQDGVLGTERRGGGGGRCTRDRKEG